MTTPAVSYEKYPFKYRVRAPPEYEGGGYYVSYQTHVRGYSATVSDPITGKFLARLFDTGQLTIYEGAPWDGPSGIALDTPSFMDASLAHDYLYEMIAQRGIPKSERRNADRTMRAIAKSHGMWWPRRVWTFWAVRKAGGPFTSIPSHV